MALDMPRWLSCNLPWWLARANTTVSIAIAGLLVLFRQPVLVALWFVWVFGVFVWGYRNWSIAGRPAIDEATTLDFQWRGLKSLWPDRNEK